MSDAPDTDDVYSWTSDPDEMRRAFVIEKMANADIERHVLIENMDAVMQWLKTGAVPKPVSSARRAPLRPVSKGDA